MESITDWAFSWPISRGWMLVPCGEEDKGEGTLVVFNDIAEVVAAAVVGFADADGVVG